MCGIFGLVRRTGPAAADLDTLARAMQRLRHRGPDDEGYVVVDSTARVARAFGGDDTPAAAYRADLRYAPSAPLPGDLAEPADVMLGHRRLAILDLSVAGRQPMSNGDGSLWLVHNGEVYNYVELRDELRAAGVTFRTETDTEVVLAAYAAWGDTCVERFVGMFAFALLDLRRRRILLARDPFGIKPLYHAEGEEAWAFASEIPALLEVPGVTRVAEPQRIYDYVRHGWTDHGEGTMFRTVRQVPAGHALVVDLKPFHLGAAVAYLSKAEPRAAHGAPRAAAEARAAFLASLRLHLRSDVPVGVALSGGVDSSAIACGVRAEAKDMALEAFSFVADDPGMSEERWAVEAARAARASMHRVTVAPDELGQRLRATVRVHGEPFASSSVLAQAEVFRAAREAGIKVMLDGQGGDELLGGYRVHVAARAAELLRRGRWGAAAGLMRGASQSKGERRRLLAMAFRDALPAPAARLAAAWAGRGAFPRWLDADWFRGRGVRTDGAVRDGSPGLHAALRRTMWDAGLPQYLRYEDRNSMACSIESRVPFLTLPMLEFFHGLPGDQLVAADGRTKALFRDAMRGLVPDAILDRRDKMGFPTPEVAWLRASSAYVEQTLGSADARRVRGVNLARIRAHWAAVRDGRARDPAPLWRTLSLIEWARAFDVAFDAESEGERA